MSDAFLQAIFVTPQAGAAMRRVRVVQALTGRGLAGDRYLLGTGYYSALGSCCEVTLIEAEALERMEAAFGVHVSQGEHRRNLVTRGIGHAELRGRRFTVGEAVLEYARPRPPCAYLERLTQPRMTRALGEGAGTCARILQGGMLHEGDLIQLLPGSTVRPFRRLP
ncbi:MAG: MOSC domain-containing protein [Verrucomicrobia bacterium]|nr:MOSC domain-containing protein [Verrucomicrobiota bacterium]